MRRKLTKPTDYWGIDTEASSSGIEPTQKDVHTVQVCSSRGEHTGKVFLSARDFKRWVQHTKPRPTIFYAFTLPFEYGTLAAWEFLKVKDGRGRYPWQDWADKPINLFYVTIDRTKIPVFDIRIVFHQLRYGNNYLTNLKAVGDYLSDFYGEDIHKLPTPLGEDFGKRPPTPEERPYFERYGIRDAYISAKAAQWVHENIISKWLGNTVPITKLYSWGTVAKYYFNLPKVNAIKRYGRKIVIEFPNMWHQKIFESTYAGRSEAFYTGNVGQVYYNDVSSLYPTSLIQTQCMLIRDVKEWRDCTDGLLGRITWQKFYETTGKPYGWIEGTFKVDDDLWGLPIKVGDNNWYITGTLKGRIYNVLDLHAASAEVLDVETVLIPIFDRKNKKTMKKFEELARIKLMNKHKSQIEKYCIKMTTNSTSGILGKSHPMFGDTTNIPAYNTLLAQSHLNMSKIFHMFHSKHYPIYYTDTDSFFWHKPVNEIVEHSRPYPDLPFQIFDTVPLEVGLRAKSRPEGAILFRGKMYYQNENSMGFSGWKPFPRFFIQIVKEKPLEIDVERQITRKWKTRDKAAVVLKIGRWFIKKEHWSLKKLKHIFRADTKRKRPTYNSYQLFLDDLKADSRSWTYQEAKKAIGETSWTIENEW